MAEFKIESVQEGNVLVVRTTGYLDEPGGAALKDACEKALTAGHLRYVLNLTGTPVINSTGLSMLLDLMVKIIDYNDGKVALTGLSKLTKTALQMTGVLNLCQNFPTEAEAVAAVNA
ncbi:MAG: STAS domain-containing protein [Candidatus Riflebacteria bacterium]|nr:STAS domain-containing protein [Candidatus Riflebacteria bacterium]